MTTQTNAREVIKNSFKTFMKESFFLVLKVLDEWIEKSIPAMKEFWYYTRWTLVIACVFCAYDVLKLTSEDNGILGIFPGTSYENLAYSGQDVLYLGLTMAWMCTIILLIAPFLFHYFLIRRPDISIALIKRNFMITED